MHITLDTLLDAMTQETPQSWTCDEMHHTGGAGISFVERWAVDARPATEGPWVWRVMWTPHRVRGGNHRHRAIRVAYGVSESPEEAQRQGRREATRLAKERRSAA